MPKKGFIEIEGIGANRSFLNWVPQQRIFIQANYLFKMAGGRKVSKFTN